MCSQVAERQIQEFGRFLGEANSLVAEAWALGRKLSLSPGITHLVVEMDSKVLYDLIWGWLNWESSTEPNHFVL